MPDFRIVEIVFDDTKVYYGMRRWVHQQSVESKHLLISKTSSSIIFGLPQAIGVLRQRLKALHLLHRRPWDEWSKL